MPRPWRRTPVCLTGWALVINAQLASTALTAYTLKVHDGNIFGKMRLFWAPRWKVNRELRRVGRQVWSGPLELYARLLGAVWPWLGGRLIRVWYGDRPPAARIALFLIFQPRGCPESLFRTLEAITAEGYAPLVVVNGALAKNDFARVARLSWRVMHRPNIGYDFGGYKDGILHMIGQDIDIEALLVLNDTIWLPAGQESFSIRHLEEIGADYAALSNFAYRPQRKRAVHLTGRAYAASFGFRLSRRVWESQAFKDFWRQIPFYGTKFNVVERGEVGFSRAMESAGFTPSALLDHSEISETILGLPTDKQYQLLGHLPVLNRALRKRRDDLVHRIETEMVEPIEVEAFLRRALGELNPWDSMVVHGLVEGKIDFIKKANLKVPDNAARFLDAIDQAGFAVNDCVRREIQLIAEIRD